MKYCINCGSEVNNESKFCGNCGNLEKAREFYNNNGIDADINKEEKLITYNQKISADYPSSGDSMKKDKSKTSILHRLGLLVLVAFLLVSVYSYFIHLNDISGVWKAENDNFVFELTIDEDEGYLSIAERKTGYNEKIANFPVTIEKGDGNSFNMEINGRKYSAVKSMGNSFIIEFHGVYTQTGWVFEEVEFVRD